MALTGMRAVKSVTELDFDEEVLRSEVPVFVDFSAEWCPPCKMAAPIVARIAERHAGALKVVEIDGGECSELAARFCVRGFPTFLGIVRGQVVDRKLGFGGAKALEELAETILDAARSER